MNDSWPNFLHPYPLSDKYFLVSCKPTPASAWGIYLVDIFDNILLLKEEPGWALFEPVPVRKTGAAADPGGQGQAGGNQRHGLCA